MSDQPDNQGPHIILNGVEAMAAFRAGGAHGVLLKELGFLQDGIGRCGAAIAEIRKLPPLAPVATAVHGRLEQAWKLINEAEAIALLKREA